MYSTVSAFYICRHVYNVLCKCKIDLRNGSTIKWKKSSTVSQMRMKYNETNVSQSLILKNEIIANT